MDPDAVVPEQRQHQIPQLDPSKVKDEMKQYADLIKVFGPNSSFVKDLDRSWHKNVPPDILSELCKFSAWSRSEEDKCFKISPSLPGFSVLVLRDSAEVTSLAQVTFFCVRYPRFAVPHM